MGNPTCKPFISVLLPSRGLSHSRTFEHVIRNVEGFNVEFLFTHDMPIPDSFNYLIEKAQGQLCWIVEEDIGFADDTLAKMVNIIAHGADVVTTDCPIGWDGKNWTSTGLHTFPNGKYFCGMGCVLARTEVLRACLPLRTDIVFDANTFEPIEGLNDSKVYGGQDVYLHYQIQKLGYNLELLPDKTIHYLLVEIGENGGKSNHGCHTIVARKYKEDTDV